MMARLELTRGSIVALNPVSHVDSSYSGPVCDRKHNGSMAAIDKTCQ